MPPENAVAVREDQHPIIAAIDAKMPEIAEILPAGMDDKRFRKVVVQAMLRNRSLWDCTPISIVTAITEAAEVGIEPTGVLGKGWLIPYGKEAKFIPGWRGFVDLCWRADKILLTVDLVRIGDDFEYRRGTDAFLHHTPDLTDPERGASADNVTFAYVLARFPDGREDFEVMSRTALDRIRDRSRSRNPVWTSDAGEMMKKTPIRRIAKRLPLSPAVQAMLGRDEEVDFDTPVERVADPKREELRDRISARTAALRGESTGESEGSEVDGAGVTASQPEGESVPAAPSGGSPARGDAWMRRLHAMGNERGYDHDALHDWACDIFDVKSLSDLDPKQRGEFAAMVERLPLIGEDCAHPKDKYVVKPDRLECGDCGATIGTRPGGEAEADRPSASPSHARPTAGEPAGASEQAPVEPPPDGEPVPQISDEDILRAAGPGAELIPPRPDSPEFRALPSKERATARAWWQEHPDEPESLAEQLRVES